jgi:hypothetical protein
MYSYLYPRIVCTLIRYSRTHLSGSRTVYLLPLQYKRGGIAQLHRGEKRFRSLDKPHTPIFFLSPG